MKTYLCTLEPFTKHQSARVLCTGDTAANHRRPATALLSMLRDTMRAGGRFGTEGLVPRPRKLTTCVTHTHTHRKRQNEKDKRRFSLRAIRRLMDDVFFCRTGRDNHNIHEILIKPRSTRVCSNRCDAMEWISTSAYRVFVMEAEKQKYV